MTPTNDDLVPSLSIQFHCERIFPDSPKVVDHIGLAEERQYKGARSPVALPDQVAPRCLGLAQPLLCNGPVQLPMVPSKAKEQERVFKILSMVNTDNTLSDLTAGP